MRRDEGRDPLERLRAANPVDEDGLPGPESAQGRVLFGRILSSSSSSGRQRSPAAARIRRVVSGRLAVAAAATFVAVLGLASLVSLVPLVGGNPDQEPAGSTRPPGNNGTVKIDGVIFDDHPNNEPHVGCVFQLDFYGYDEGDLWATYTFRIWPPTGPMETLLTDTIFIGEDPAGGGTDLDASVTVDLTSALAGYTPHPIQGHHVKLTVDAEGSIGADVKHKVFWVGPCEVYPPPS